MRRQDLLCLRDPEERPGLGPLSPPPTVCCALRALGRLACSWKAARRARPRARSGPPRAAARGCRRCEGCGGSSPSLQPLSRPPRCRPPTRGAASAPPR
eukprot:9466302-Pyramimonas_sp.AAC.1